MLSDMVDGMQVPTPPISRAGHMLSRASKSSRVTLIHLKAEKMCLHRLPHLSSLRLKLGLKLDVEVEVEAGGVDLAVAFVWWTSILQ